MERIEERVERLEKFMEEARRTFMAGAWIVDLEKIRLGMPFSSVAHRSVELNEGDRRRAVIEKILARREKLPLLPVSVDELLNSDQ